MTSLSDFLFTGSDVVLRMSNSLIYLLTIFRQIALAKGLQREEGSVENE